MATATLIQLGISPSPHDGASVSFGRVEYLEDEDVVRSRFRKHDNYGNWDDYLGLEHPQVPGTGRKKHTARAHTDKPVKIYG